MRQKKIKVLHGMVEIGGQTANSARGLRKNKVDAKSAIYEKNFYFDLPNDYTLDTDLSHKKNVPLSIIKMFSFFIFTLFKFNVFHFHFGRSLLPKNYDLKILKLLKKTIILEFRGSDLRVASLAKQINPYSNQIEKNEHLKIKNNKYRVEYADGIVLHDTELLPYLPKSNVPVCIIPSRPVIDKIIPTPIVENTKIKIVHSPTNRRMKGSDKICEVINQLQKKYDIDFILVEGKSNQEAFKIYKTADIIIDQLNTGAYGVFAIECMALGKPVITYIMDDMKKSYPESLPIISASEKNLSQVLTELINNEQLRVEANTNGPKYVSKYHDYIKTTKIMKSFYEDVVNNRSTIFRDGFKEL